VLPGNARLNLHLRLSYPKGGTGDPYCRFSEWRRNLAHLMSSAILGARTRGAAMGRKR